MIYTDEQIRETILTHIHETDQHELKYLIPFCLGYYGYVTKQIWNVLYSLMKDDYII